MWREEETRKHKSKGLQRARAEKEALCVFRECYMRSHSSDRPRVSIAILAIVIRTLNRYIRRDETRQNRNLCDVYTERRCKL